MGIVRKELVVADEILFNVWVQDASMILLISTDDTLCINYYIIIFIIIIVITIITTFTA